MSETEGGDVTLDGRGGDGVGTGETKLQTYVL